MCLHITDESKAKTTAIKRKGGVITAYKVVTVKRQSPFYTEFSWPKSGVVESGRKSARRTKRENEYCEIDKGIHLVTRNPGNEKGQYLNQYRCRYRCQCRCQCRYQYRNRNRCPYYIVLEVQVNVSDIIAYGTWEGEESIAVTKCEVTNG